MHRHGVGIGIVTITTSSALAADAEPTTMIPDFTLTTAALAVKARNTANCDCETCLNPSGMSCCTSSCHICYILVWYDHHDYRACRHYTLRSTHCHCICTILRTAVFVVGLSISAMAFTTSCSPETCSPEAAYVENEEGGGGC